MRIKRINQLAPIDRPREKLIAKGTAALSDFELLEVLIGTGNRSADVSYIARQVQALFQGGTNAVTLESLTAIRGINVAIASRILASLEVAQRYLVRDVERLRTVRDIIARFDDIRSKQQEHLVCMTLDGGQRLIAQRIISIGTLDSALAHPREVFSNAVTDRAAHIVVAHNHPSGDATPSTRDITLTQQLVAAGLLLGIPLRDHLILTRTEYFSFDQHHML
jgi:DNA repair protein RadC